MADWHRAEVEKCRTTIHLKLGNNPDGKKKSYTRTPMKCNFSACRCCGNTSHRMKLLLHMHHLEVQWLLKYCECGYRSKIRLLGLLAGDLSPYWTWPIIMEWMRSVFKSICNINAARIRLYLLLLEICSPPSSPPSLSMENASFLQTWSPLALSLSNLGAISPNTLAKLHFELVGSGCVGLTVLYGGRCVWFLFVNQLKTQSSFFENTHFEAASSHHHRFPVHTPMAQHICLVSSGIVVVLCLLLPLPLWSSIPCSRTQSHLHTCSTCPPSQFDGFVLATKVHPGLSLCSRPLYYWYLPINLENLLPSSSP